MIYTVAMTKREKEWLNAPMNIIENPSNDSKRRAKNRKNDWYFAAKRNAFTSKRSHDPS